MSRQERAFAYACECLAIEQLWRKIILEPEKLCFRRGGVTGNVSCHPPGWEAALRPRRRAMCQVCMQGETRRQEFEQEQGVTRLLQDGGGSCISLSTLQASEKKPLRWDMAHGAEVRR